jgi:beta-galactosidase
MTISGVGQSFLNPYAFLSAGLCNASNVELTNGNERGVATLRAGESHVGFKGLDFGDYGSGEVTLPLFPLDGEPFDFEIWEGMPAEGGERLCSVRWDKGSVWNTYQDITVRLPRRLRGVTALCLVFRQKVHIKGFRFTNYEKAFQTLPAAACDRVYGDAFTVRGGAVEGIGNNVTLVFERMDFGAAGAGRVALRWRSRLEKNAVHLLFEGPEGRRRQVIETPRAENYTDAVFPLEQPVFGPQTAQLVFLPGCEMDLEWVRFLPLA